MSLPFKSDFNIIETVGNMSDNYLLKRSYFESEILTFKNNIFLKISQIRII